MSEPRTQIAIAVVQRGEQVLIGRRSADASLAGHWEFPGGKVEAGESPEAAAVRECREESGLDVTVAAPHAIVDHDYSHDRVRLRFFLCRPLDLRQVPRAPFRWVNRQQLGGLRFPAANRGIIQFLMNPPP